MFLFLAAREAAFSAQPGDSGASGEPQQEPFAGLNAERVAAGERGLPQQHLSYGALPTAQGLLYNPHPGQVSGSLPSPAASSSPVPSGGSPSPRSDSRESLAKTGGAANITGSVVAAAERVTRRSSQPWPASWSGRRAPPCATGRRHPPRSPPPGRARRPP